VLATSTSTRTVSPLRMLARARRGAEISKRRVGEAETEGVERRDLVEQIAAPAGGLVVVEDRQLAHRAGDRHRQLAARIGPAEQDVGDGVSGLLAQVPALDQGVGAGGQIVDRQRPAVEQQHDGRLAQGEDGAARSFCWPIRSRESRSPRWLSAQASRLVCSLSPSTMTMTSASAASFTAWAIRPALTSGDQVDRVGRPDAALGDPHALRIDHLEAAPGLGLQALQHADHVGRDLAVAADRRVARVGAQHRELADCPASSGRMPASFFSSTIARCGGFAGQGDGVGRRGQAGGGAGVDVGVSNRPARNFMVSRRRTAASIWASLTLPARTSSGSLA
jgi:hypothetical protein